MVEPNEVEEVEEVEKKEDITATVAAFQERKTKAAEELKKIKSSKSRSKPVPVPVEKVKPDPEIVDDVKQPKPKKVKPPVDMKLLNHFKNKLIKDFGLTESKESSGNIVLKYNKFLMIKLLPRRNCRFGVCREVPEEVNKWKAFKVSTDEEEQKVYNHVKKLVKLNKPESS